MRKANKKRIVKQCSKWILENYVFLTYNDIVLLNCMQKSMNMILVWSKSQTLVLYKKIYIDW